MKVIVSPLAAQDLKEAYDFIAKDNTRAADDVLVQISEVMGLIASGRARVP